MKIDKEFEDKRVANTIRYLDGFGKEIPNAISFDDSSNIVIVWEPIDGPNGKGLMVKKQKFQPQCMPVVDNIAKPDEEQLSRIREKYTGKRER